MSELFTGFDEPSNPMVERRNKILGVGLVHFCNETGAWDIVPADEAIDDTPATHNSSSEDLIVSA